MGQITYLVLTGCMNVCGIPQTSEKAVDSLRGKIESADDHRALPRLPGFRGHRDGCRQLATDHGGIASIPLPDVPGAPVGQMAVREWSDLAPSDKPQFRRATEALS